MTSVNLLASSLVLASLAFTAAMTADDDAFAQDNAALHISLAKSDPYEVGSPPQSVSVRVAYQNGTAVTGADARFELIDPTGASYCLCQDARTDLDGIVTVRWGSAAEGMYTLRVSVQDQERTDHVGQFVIRAVTSDASSSASDGMHVWIPPKMIEGQRYEGVVIIDSERQVDAWVLLSSSDPLSVHLDASILIPAGSNHAVFDVSPTSSGSLTVYASIRGPLAAANSEVYPPHGVPARLEIVFASEKTKARQVATYVFVLDSNGSPSRVDFDLDVWLESGSSLDAPSKVIVRKGEFYQRFSTTVHGDGSLRAHAEGLTAGYADINAVPDDLDLMLGIAPDPIGPHSRAYYYIWLEKNGHPYSHPTTIVGQIHASDTTVAGFSRSNSSPNHDSERFYMQNGVSRGTIYTRELGTATIHVSVPDIGVTTHDITVGISPMNAQDNSPDAECDVLVTSGANAINTWIYPTISTQMAWMVIAPYSDHFTNSTAPALNDEDHFNDDILHDCSIRHPHEVDNQAISVSIVPTGVSYDRDVILSPHSFRTFGSEFEISADVLGNYTASVTATNIGSAESSFRIAQPYDEQYDLLITPLPVMPGAIQDVALISVVDSDGAQVDTKDVFGHSLTVRVAGTRLDSEVELSGDSIPLRSSLDGDTIVTASSGGLSSNATTISVSSAIRNVDLAVPSIVHMHEEFPFALHEVDSSGVPHVIPDRIDIAANALEILWDERRMIAMQKGELIMSALTDYGAVQESTNVFAGALNLNIQPPIYARTGTPSIIDVFASTDDIRLDVESPLSWTLVEHGRIKLSSDVSGTFPVTVFASKPGYVPESHTFNMVFKDRTYLNITAKGTDGSDLYIDNVDLAFHTYGTSSIGDNATAVLPWNKWYDDILSVQISFPEIFHTDAGYIFSKITVNGKDYPERSITMLVDGDLIITAVYDRSILVGVDSDDARIDGMGYYKYGDDVVLSAHPRSEIPFLITEVLDRWHNVPDNATINEATIKFVAYDDVDITASYRHDYTGFMSMALFLMIVTGAVMLTKSRHSVIVWTLRNLFDSLKASLRAGLRNRDRSDKDLHRSEEDLA